MREHYDGKKVNVLWLQWMDQVEMREIYDWKEGQWAVTYFEKCGYMSGKNVLCRKVSNRKLVHWHSLYGYSNKRTHEKLWTKERLNEWMSEWMDEWMDEWMNGWMNEWMNERMDEWMNEWEDKWMNEWMHEWMNGWMNERTSARNKHKHKRTNYGG